MNNKEILEKAIQKAIDGGWLGVKQSENLERIYYYPDSSQILKWRWEEDGRCFSDGAYDDYESINVEVIIFNHDFAKALWGQRQFDAYGVDHDLLRSNDAVTGSGGPDEDWYEHPIWMWHLQQMVVADDPIKYLGRNI